ncbi:MAG: GEVED domain-containing protein [Flavobacterium sp.]|uniref:GEVED domain-containing protein n=1 Tax=Flavobacterium sp. TaxID=239 RepID=UPI0032656EE7
MKNNYFIHVMGGLFILKKPPFFSNNSEKKNKSKIFTGLFFLFATLFSFNVANSQTFTDNTPGTRNFTVPCDVTSITIRAWGAGGAGGAADNTPNGGSGGGGGGYSTYTATVVPGQIIAYTVGTGGTGSANNGGNGTATTILAITANGGNGGGQNQGAIGTGGTATGGAINGGTDTPGGNGSLGTILLGAAGGTCNALAGGTSRNTTGNGNGATNSGSGGGGALRISGGSGRNGGNGSNGQITITYTIISPYCLPTFTNAIEPITNVTFAGINNTTSATVGGTPSLEVFCSSSATVVQGSSYNEISIKGNTDGAFEDFFKAYIDWDQNGVFGNNPNEIYSLGSILNSTGVDAITLISSISVPSGALLGNTKMRVMKRYGGYPNDPCQTGAGYGQAEDYIVNVIAQTPCITPTTQPTALILTPVGQSIGGTFTHAAPRPNQYLVVISTSNIAPTPANGTTYSIGDSVAAGYTVVDIDANNNFNAGALNLNTTYYFYIFSFNSACTGGPLYRNVLPLTGNATTPAVPTGYCTPATTSVATDRLYVTNVDFVGTMLDQSTVSTTDTPADGYQDWTARPKCIQAQGGAINMKLSSNAVRGFWKVWVDWNKDGDFLDAGEEVYNPGGFLFSSTTFGFIIPSYAPVGDYRIRVRVQNTYRNSNGAETLVDFNSCNSFDPITISGINYRTYGEAEDYLFTVIPKCDNIITSITNPAICGAVSGTVTATISATSTAGTINWYDALTGGTLLGNTASGANWTTPSISASTTYYATALGSCESLIRTPVFVEVKPVPALIIATPNVTVCGENSIIRLDATGDDEVAYLINENFETGTLGVFTNINSDATSAADKAKTAWKNKTSIFVPSGARWFPAITSGFGTNKFALTSFDDFSGSFPTVPMENSLTLASNANSTGFTNLTLSFRIFYSRYYADGINPTIENCNVEVSTNGGGAWTTLPAGTFTADQGYGSSFITATFPMTGYINNTMLKIRIRALGDGTASGLAGDGVAIDDVKLFGDRPLTPFFALGGGVDGFYDATATTTPYDGQPANTIYIRPTLTQLEQPAFVINVSSNLNNGCVTSGTINVTNNTKIWKGTTSGDWNTASNWAPAIIPTIANCVVIPTALPNPTTLSTGAAGNGKNLTIKNGGILEIQSGNALTIKEIVDVNAGGTFNIKNNSSLVQIDNVTNLGDINMERIANLRFNDYSYWSSPVGNLIAGTFPVTNISPLTPTNYIFNWLTTGVNANGGQGNWDNVNENMIPTKGYIVRGPNGFNNTATTPLTANFIGVPNNGTFSASIFRGTDFTTIGTQGIPRTATDDNWNLLGNPYPSSLGVNEFLTANPSIQGFVKIWTHGTLPSLIASDPFYQDYVYNYTAGDYLTINATGATSGPGNYKIGAGQSFMVLMNAGVPGSGSVTFNNTMRSATFANNQFYKNGSSNNSTTVLETNRIWLDLVSSTGTVSRTLVGYLDGATQANDRLYDTFTDNKNAQNFYSLINNEPMLIQGRSLPFDNNDLVPLGIKVPTNGTYNIAIATVDGVFTNGSQTIYLEDKLLNITHNLAASQYQFTADQGTVNDRFVLRYTNNTLSNSDFDYSNEVKIYANSSINISSINKSIKEVIICDVSGKVLVDKKEINKKEISLSELGPTTNVLIVKVILENNNVVIKKVIY